MNKLPTIPASADTATSKAVEQGDNVRVVGARVLHQVIYSGQSLTTVLPAAAAQVAAQDRGLLQEICYGALRWYHQLSYLLKKLLDKPLKAREHELYALLIMGLYQLEYLRLPAYAAVSETVNAARVLGKPWAAGLVNAVLRNFQRRRTALLAELGEDTSLRTSHPPWLFDRLQQDWPDDWGAIVAANNIRPPLHLRVNHRRLSRADYLQHLSAAGFAAVATPYAPAGITLKEACDVTILPGFDKGWISVQDSAAQLAATLLGLAPHLRILDACAAPGGKTAHILESEPRLNQVVAVDEDAGRLQRLNDNLARLGLTARTRIGDIQHPETWWDGVLFDRILLDAPCSATGVIRRHPDIKLLRTAADPMRLAARQLALLQRLWPMLAPGGLLVYATCSVLKQENENVVMQFLAAQDDAWERPITAPWGRPCTVGRQILPGEADMDGFFYACLNKPCNG